MHTNAPPVCREKESNKIISLFRFFSAFLLSSHLCCSSLLVCFAPSSNVLLACLFALCLVWSAVDVEASLFSILLGDFSKYRSVYLASIHWRSRFVTHDGSLLVVSSVNLSQTIDLQLFLTILHTYYFNTFSRFDLFQFLY